MLPTLMLAGLIGASGAANAIVGGPLNGAPTDSPQQRVDSNVPTSQFGGVGSISIGANTFSGVLIGPRDVLTAAHAVSGANSANINFNLNLTGALSSTLQAASVTIYPGYKGVTGSDDLALIRLRDAAPEGTPIYTIASNPLTLGQQITLVGYGRGGDGISGLTTSADPGIKRSGSNVVDFFISDVHGVHIGYVYDFDGPTGVGALGGKTLGNRLEATVASGDSGGPAFVLTSSGIELVGINTSQFQFGALAPAAPLFGSGGGGVLLAPYADWIYANRLPAPEPQQWLLLLEALPLVALRLHRKNQG